MPNSNMLEGIQYDVVETPLPENVLVDHSVQIPLRDGLKLTASLYRPRASSEPVPVIIAISPYGKTNFDGIKIFAKVPNNHIGHIKISDSVSFEAPDPGFWVPNGYAVLQVDVRGVGESEGAPQPLSATEQADYLDIIAWAAAQSWSSGSVGLLGVSYLCITQWAVAQHRPPALKAIIPWEGFSDAYLRAYPGGIPEVGMWKFVLNDWILPNLKNPSQFQGPPPGFRPGDHPLRDEYWDAQEIAIEKVAVPVLLCASFSDQGLHSRDSFLHYDRIQHRQKWMFSHHRPKWDAFYDQEALEWQLRFFDRFLRNIDNGFESRPSIRYDVHENRETYVTHTSPIWPPQNAQLHSLFLNAATGATASSPPLDESFASYKPGEGNAQFDHVFDQDTIVVGGANLKLWLEAVDCDDLDLFAAIKKVDQGGHEVYFYGFGGTNPNDVVSRGWLRASHRDLDLDASRVDRPIHTHRRSIKFKPGEIVPVEIEMLPSATLFRAGETLRVVVQGEAVKPDAVLLEFLSNKEGTHRIWTGDQYKSQLIFRAISIAEQN